MGGVGHGSAIERPREPFPNPWSAQKPFRPANLAGLGQG